jgi:CheY-like chemotaxis protein
MLQRLGFAVVSASNGHRAVELFHKHHHDIACVLLDLTMPEQSGVATVPFLQAINPDVPIILMSGYSEEELTLRYPHLGLKGFLAKPFTLQSLHHIVQQFVRVGGAAG